MSGRGDSAVDATIQAARAAFRAGTDQVAPEMFESLVEIATGSMKPYTHELVCKCGFRDRQTFSVPDQASRLKAVQILLEHGWGRPASVAPERDAGELASKDLSELTAAERAELLAYLRGQLEELKQRG